MSISKSLFDHLVMGERISSLESKLVGAFATVTDLRMQLAEERESHEATKSELAAMKKRLEEAPKMLVDRYGRLSGGPNEVAKLDMIIDGIERFDYVAVRIVKES